MSNLNKFLDFFYCPHFDGLNRFLVRRVTTPEGAADLTQEVFTRILERGDKIEEIRHPRGYLFRSAKNLAAELWRAPNQEFVEAIEDWEHGLSDSPEDILHHRQTLSALLTAIENLPPRCREVFLLHRFEGMSYPEIATQLGIGISAVEKQMMRAMKACRNAFE